jgi:hypothetical protein
MPSKPPRDTPRAIAEQRIQAALRKQLRELDLRELGLTSTESRITWGDIETSDTSLVGFWSELVSLPESLCRLASLQSLDLSNNQLSSLPETLSHLRSLQSLGLSGNQLTSIPESVGQLASLQNLDLFGNRLASLPESIGYLTSLQTFDLAANKLASLPRSIGNLTNLKTFDLGGNQFISLPRSIGRLTNLQTLDLTGNRLTGLPAEIRELRMLAELYLHGNPALGIPAEVLGPTRSELWGSEKKRPADPAAILDYYFRIHPPHGEGKRKGRVLRELKVILVGRGEVGKTTLIEVLKGGKFVEGMKKTEGMRSRAGRWCCQMARLRRWSGISADRRSCTGPISSSSPTVPFISWWWMGGTTEQSRTRSIC